jgi:rfaE bifunctional protein kinase chain/domain
MDISKENINQIFERFKDLNVLIVGDVMMDAYIFGKVERISPEAPVPVVNLQKEENRLGGAANVAMNIVSLGAKATICSIIGDDKEGHLVESLFANKHISTDGLFKSAEKPTTVKTRIIGNNHQLLRIDRELTDEPSDEIEDKFIHKIKEIVGNHQVIIFSDYDKGSLTKKLIHEIIVAANALNIPTIVDPKNRHFLDYKTVTLFKPNLKELAEGLKTSPIKPNKESISDAVSQLHAQLHNRYSMITLSEFGMMIYDHHQQSYIQQPAHLRNIADVSGAGDTVVSVASLCLALHLSAETIIYLSNLAGGLVCEEVGVVPINREKLLSEALNS